MRQVKNDKVEIIKKENKIIEVVSWNKKADLAVNQKSFHCKKQKPLFN